MGKYLLRLTAYFGIFLVLWALSLGVEGSVLGFFLLALTLTLANLIVRPLLVLIALPFNLLTYGIASLFVNMLTLLIADAIVASASVTGFWPMALVSLLVVAADALIRTLRRARLVRRGA